MFDEPGVGRRQRMQKMEMDHASMMQTLGVIVCRSGEVHLVSTTMPHLVTDAPTWAAALVASMRPKIEALDVTSAQEAQQLREILNGLDAWLDNPNANAHRIQWVLPLAERQRLLPDILKVDSAGDLDRLIAAILAAAPAKQRVDLTPTFDLSLPIPRGFEEQIQQVERAAESLMIARTRHFPTLTIEWVMTDATLENAVADAHVPSLHATPRLMAILETCSPYLTACISDGGEAELAMAAANEAFQDAAYRAEVAGGSR